MSETNSELWMLERMRQTPTFTFADLWTPYGGQSPEYRRADRLIQNERKAGHIRQVKRGVWEVVPSPPDTKEEN